MANEGKRGYCRCIQNMTMIIAKEETIIFTKTKIYPYMMRISDKEVCFYKIYGEEFALSCSENEFKDYFRLIKHM